MRRDDLASFQAIVTAPFGAIGIQTSSDALAGLRLMNEIVPFQSAPKASMAAQVALQLERYFADAQAAFDFPIKLEGTPHELAVWRAMQAIPCGETRTYGEIANGIGSSARAVGTACGLNPIPIFVPCHRVVAASGIGGFMGGKGEAPLAIKRWLLAHECGAEGFYLR